MGARLPASARAAAPAVAVCCTPGSKLRVLRGTRRDTPRDTPGHRDINRSLDPDGHCVSARALRFAFELLCVAAVIVALSGLASTSHAQRCIRLARRRRDSWGSLLQLHVACVAVTIVTASRLCDPTGNAQVLAWRTAGPCTESPGHRTHKGIRSQRSVSLHLQIAFVAVAALASAIPLAMLHSHRTGPGAGTGPFEELNLLDIAKESETRLRSCCCYCC